jgi:hypothetical protein
MASTAQIQKRRAANWYVWLWLSPLLTLPTLYYLYSGNPGFALVCGDRWAGCDHALADRVTLVVAVLGSALWHLILLFPALKDDSEFVRWHGRQALFLAGIRTAVPLVCGLLFGASGVCLFMLLLLPTYLVGNTWGKGQANQGDCSLARWRGREEALPPPEPDEVLSLDPDALVEIIRYSRNPEERRQALADLEELGMVEPL